MMQTQDITAFAPPKAPLPMPPQVIEPRRRPVPALWRALAPWLGRPAD
jgi:hypothetical protein